MYKIAYIDENKRDISNFQNYVYHAPTTDAFELDALEPKPDLDKFVTELLESHYKAYIIDFHLSEKNSTIHYDGWDLAKKILAIREKFPVFILTSYEEHALNDSDDVNIVYEKNKVVHAEDFRFLARVKLQIEKYNKAIETDEARIIGLIKLKKTRPLNAKEESELIELDTKIERTLNKKESIPHQLKETTNEIKLNEMLTILNKMDEILEKNTYASNKSV